MIILDDHWKPIQCFVDLVETVLPENGSVLEVGCFTGDTTIHYAPIVKRKNGSVTLVDWFRGNAECPKGGIHGLDTFEPSTLRDKLERRLEKIDCLSITTIVQSDSAIAPQNPQLQNKKFNIVFIDGSHNQETITRDLINYFPLVKPNGVFCGHDYNQSPVQTAVDKFFADLKKEVSIVKDPNGQLQPVWLVKV